MLMSTKLTSMIYLVAYKMTASKKQRYVSCKKYFRPFGIIKTNTPLEQQNFSLSCQLLRKAIELYPEVNSVFKEISK